MELFGYERNFISYIYEPLFFFQVDAHPDLNSPVGSMTGNAHGMSALSSLKVLEVIYIFFSLRFLSDY